MTEPTYTMPTGVAWDETMRRERNRENLKLAAEAALRARMADPAPEMVGPAAARVDRGPRDADSPYLA